MLKKYITCIWALFFLSLTVPLSYAEPDEGVGQTIQIYTQLHSFIGKPSWLLIVRDLDHNQNLPYLFDIQTGNNFWVAFTYGRNYLITVSRLQFAPYRRWPYKTRNINNFCDLESNGRIIKGQSIYITIKGDLTPTRDTFTCHVSNYSDANFTIVNPANSTD